MPIYIGLIAQNRVIVAKQSIIRIDFDPLIKEVIRKVPLQTEYVTLAADKYCIHYTISDMILFLCITDFDFDRSKAFGYLEKIRKKWIECGHGKSLVRINDALAKQIVNFNNKRRKDLKHIDLIDKKIKKLDDLNIKYETFTIIESSQSTSNLSESALLITNNSRKGSQRFFHNLRVFSYQHRMLIVSIIVVILLLLLFFILAETCNYSWTCDQ